MAISAFRKPAQQSSGGGLGQLLQGLGTVAGGVVGGFAGGPMGAITGAGAGGSLGATLGGMADPVKEGESAKEVGGLAPQQDNGAMSRRLTEMNNSPSVQIADASQAMAKMPPDIQQEYGPVLSQAQKLSMNRRV